MPKLTEVIAEATERVAIVGLPGTGKTTLAAALAEKFNLIWIETENDSAVLRKLPTAWQERVTFINIPDSAVVPMAADTLMHLFKNGKGSICAQHGKYACAICKKEGGAFDEVDFSKLGPQDVVVLNTATQLSASILAHTMKGKPVDAKPERDDWGSLRKFCEYFGSQFQAASFNFVVICHAVEATLEDNKVKLVPNFGSKDMSANFAKYFDHVIYCDVVNNKHKAFSSSLYRSGILTKSRTDFEIEKLAEPSLIPLFTKAAGTVVQKQATKLLEAVAEVKTVDGLAEISTALIAGIPPADKSPTTLLQDVQKAEVIIVSDAQKNRETEAAIAALDRANNTPVTKPVVAPVSPGMSALEKLRALKGVN